jgi:lysophospholipase L1-like esterase
MLVGVVFGVAVAEAALTIANVAPIEDLRYLPSWANVQDPLYGWSQIPNNEFRYQTKSVNFDTPVKINARGLRERDYEYQKPQGVYRILILGDSFIPSLEVPFDQIWHELLERKLNEGGLEGKVEVIAAGVQGWSIDQQLLYYRHEGHKYNADLVLLQAFLSNDITEADIPLNRMAGGTLEYQKPYFKLANGKLELRNFPYRGEGYWLDSKPEPSLAGRVKKVLRRNTRLYRYITMTLLAPKRPRQAEGPRLPFGCWTGEKTGFWPPLLLYAADYPPEFQAGWQLYGALVRQLKAEVIEHGQRFAVVSFPHRRQVMPVAWTETLDCWPKMKTMLWDLDKPDNQLAGVLRSEGVEFFAMAGPLRRVFARAEKPLYIERDNHFNRDGHVQVADLLYEWLKERNLAPR